MKKTLRKIALIVIMAATVVFAAVSNGKWGVKELVYTIALPLALVVSCKNEPDTPVNKPPTAHAGDAQTVKLRDNLTITLDGSLSSDPDGTIADYAWALKNAPDGVGKDSVTIVNDPVNTGKAGATGIQVIGDYIFELTVTDNNGAANAATVTVTVVENVPPVAVAGVDGGALEDGKYEFDFTSPDNRSITLKGSGTDTDGTIAANGYAWACTKSPDNSFAAFTSTEQNPTINNFPKLGDYEFSLKVKDNDGAESAASVVKVALYRTASATVGVEAVSQTGGDTKLPFTPAYTSTNTTDFPVADMSEYITYKVTATNDSYENTWNSADDFDGEVPYRAEYEDEWTTFTQVFYDKDDNAIAGKNRVVISYACTGIFIAFDGDPAWNPDLNIPGVSGISLSKKVSEGNVQ